LSDKDSDADKDLPPSERKLEKAREDGSGLKAPDLMLTLSMGMVGIGLSVAMGEVESSWLNFWKWELYWSRQGGLRLEPLFGLMGHIFAVVFGVLAVAGVISALAAWALNGFIFSAKAVSFDLSRLDPIKKLGEMFSSGAAQIWWPFIKGITALGLMVLGVQIFVESVTEGGAPLISALKASSPSLVGFVFFSFLDFLIQAWRRSKSLGMTLQELKDEMKESDGDPMIKAKMRAIARQRARSRMMSAIASADVVVVNPEHYLVALKWDPKKANAPVVVARARDLMALGLKARAAELGVPVLEAPPFARALWAACRMDEAVPALFYESIAVLLAWAYAVRDGKRVAEPAMNIPAQPAPAEVGNA
jgi:flagellar biosynthetic protein FlhB